MAGRMAADARQAAMAEGGTADRAITEDANT